jgi:hypothetical protein
MKPPIFLSDEVRAVLMSLMDEVAAALGCPDAYVSVVTHGARVVDGVTRFDFGLASDSNPELIRALRKCFPRRQVGLLRATTGPFGDLNLENVAVPDLQAALLAWRRAGSAGL